MHYVRGKNQKQLLLETFIYQLSQKVRAEKKINAKTTVIWW